jgi:hypothetical protein
MGFERLEHSLFFHFKIFCLFVFFSFFFLFYFIFSIGYHGEMGYLAREDAVLKRKEPTRLVPGAISAIVATLNYDPGLGVYLAQILLPTISLHKFCSDKFRSYKFHSYPTNFAPTLQISLLPYKFRSYKFSPRKSRSYKFRSQLQFSRSSMTILIFWL